RLAVVRRHTPAGNAATRAVPRRRIGPHADDDRQPADDRCRSRADRRTMPSRGRVADRRHARDRYDGRHCARPRKRIARQQDDRVDRRDGAVCVRQLRRTVQSRQRAVVRAGPRAGRVRRDERPLLRLEQGEEEHADGRVRGDMTKRSTQRTPRPQRWVLYGVFFVSFVSLVSRLSGQSDEAIRLLEQYVSIDTSNPPGDTRKSADFLESILKREGIPVTRYESAADRSIVIGRLKATTTPAAGKALVLMHHMDVVPADRSQWKTDPFKPVIQNGAMWGRGSFDMKGQGVSQLLAFLELKRQRVPLNRDVILLAEPDEEIGGA